MGRMSKSPFDIDHRLDREKLTVRAIVETPAGSTIKFAFDPKTRLFAASKLLPVGLSMPLDFGFVPSSCGGDGDPLDIMIMPEAPLPTGCLVEARILGVIEVEQKKDEPGAEAERNDRVVARLEKSLKWAHVEDVGQLGDAFVRQLNQFFKTYKAIKGQDYRVLGVRPPDRAAELIEQAASAYAAASRKAGAAKEMAEA